MRISDQGELDYLTPGEPSAVEKAIADAARHAIDEQRYYLNTQDRIRRERAKSRAMKEQADRDYLTHNPTLDGQS